jgi:transcriptional regulator with PAS, ATPase and Fis domain
MLLDILERELRKEIESWKAKMLSKLCHDTQAIQEQIHARISKARESKTTPTGDYGRMSEVREAIKRHDGNKTRAARELGLTRAGLHYWLEKM